MSLAKAVAPFKAAAYDGNVSRARRVAGLAVLALAAGGCFLFPSGEPSRVEEVPSELRRPVLAVPAAPDRHPYGDRARLEVGQWARYREPHRTVTIAVVGREGEDLWIEVIDEGRPRQISVRRVAPDGTVRQAFYGEVSSEGEPSEVVPQPLAQRDGRGPAPSPPAGAPGRREATERVRVGDRELEARAERIRTEDLEGRLVEEEWLWHPEVPPVYAGGPRGGLVRYRGPQGGVELEAWGADARPHLELPR